MKTVSINLYSVEELSEKAFDKAYMEWYCNWEYPWWDEVNKVLSVVEELFKIRITKFDVSRKYGFNYRKDFEDYSIEELIQFVEYVEWVYRKDECEKTGYYLEVIIPHEVKKWGYIKTYKDYEDLVDTILKEISNWVEDDIESLTSEEGFKEWCENYDALFYEDGRMF